MEPDQLPLLAASGAPRGGTGGCEFASGEEAAVRRPGRVGNPTAVGRNRNQGSGAEVRPSDEVDLDAYDRTMARAGRLLARRAHAEEELRRKLLHASPPDMVERVVARLRDLGLLDDQTFARAWIEERLRRSPLGAEALIAGLAARGVDRGVAEAAVDEAGMDEEAQATATAARLARGLADRPLGEQAARLQAMLLRRGFSPEAAESGARAVLPPEGWD